jgi:N-acetylmuramoyl-L-alanine amidase
MKNNIIALLIGLFLLIAAVFLSLSQESSYATSYPIKTHKIKVKDYLAPLPINTRIFSKKEKKELECLTKNMYHESKGEGSIGWLAVGMVTMNRVESKRYPNTICKVVHQNNGKVWQFSWVGTKKKLTKPKKVLYNKIYNLAVLIYLYHEHMYDITDEAIYFHADYVTPYWSKKVEKTVQIGSHIFYKN